MNVATAPLVSLRGLSIRFGPDTRPPTVDAVDLDIARGEIVALVGESGSGKSLLAHAIAGILTPAARLGAERLEFAGVDLRRRDARAWADIRGREIGVVFQNARAALNPIRPVGQQIADVIRQHRMLAGHALDRAVIAALQSVRIPDPERRASALPGALSGGMCQRVMLTIAMAGDPALLIADEPTTGLDATTQASILDLVLEHAERRRMATLLITHDLGLARAYAHRVVVMHAGQIVEIAPTPALFAFPHHPYSSALIAATPADASSIDHLAGIAGALPSLDAAPPCRYADRCERALAVCRTQRPEMSECGSEHASACWNPL
jgi:oligopeptide/dipeptide ABC transporter ATP-binding protein